MTRNAGKFRVSMELLEKLLHIPFGHRVIGVGSPSHVTEEYFEVFCEGPTLPTVLDGQKIPEVNFTVTKMQIHGEFSERKK